MERVPRRLRSRSGRTICVPPIVRKLPFFKTRTSVTVGGQEVLVKSDQIVVWMSLSEGGKVDLDLDLDQLRFPAIVDTGHTHNFSIQEQQLAQWAGLDPRLLTKL